MAPPMSTITLPPEPETGETTSLTTSPLARRAVHGAPFPEPEVGKLRGPRLVAVWTVLTIGAWAVLGGTGYGLYVVVSSFLL